MITGAGILRSGVPAVVGLAAVALAAPSGVPAQEAAPACESAECCREAEGAVLHGEVLAAESSTPIPGATVELGVTAPPEEGERSTHEVRTDEAGAYRLCGIPTPARVEAQAEKSGATSRSVSFRLDAPGRVELSFEIKGVPSGLDSLQAAAAAARDEAEPGRVVGRIEDADTGRPVSEATLTLEPSGRRALTDGQGRFEIPEAPAGQGELAIHHVAYGDQTVQVEVPPELTVSLEIELPPKAIEVEPLEVSVESTIRSRHLEWRGFYDRMARGFGHFWTPEDLERRNPLTVSHVLQQTPGVGLRRECGGTCRSYPVMKASTCQATVYMDGHKAPLDEYTGIDDLVNVQDLAAIEVYRGAAGTAPGFIDSDSRCGVIALWTKRGPGPPGGGQR